MNGHIIFMNPIQYSRNVIVVTRQEIFNWTTTGRGKKISIKFGYRGQFEVLVSTVSVGCCWFFTIIIQRLSSFRCSSMFSHRWMTYWAGWMHRTGVVTCRQSINHCATVLLNISESFTIRRVGRLRLVRPRHVYSNFYLYIYRTRIQKWSLVSVRINVSMQNLTTFLCRTQRVVTLQ